MRFCPDLSLSLSLRLYLSFSLSLLGGHERDRSWFIFNSFDPVSRLFVCIIRAHFPFAQVVSSVLAIEQASFRLLLFISRLCASDIGLHIGMRAKDLG